MDPNKIKEVKRIIKKQSKLANLKRIKELIFTDPGNLVLCSVNDLYNKNNQLKGLPKDVTDEIENLIQDWIEKTEEGLTKEMEEL